MQTLYWSHAHCGGQCWLWRKRIVTSWCLNSRACPHAPPPQPATACRCCRCCVLQAVPGNKAGSQLAKRVRCQDSPCCEDLAAVCNHNALDHVCVAHPKVVLLPLPAAKAAAHPLAGLAPGPAAAAGAAACRL
jgi:hypothetical protein